MTPTTEAFELWAKDCLGQGYSLEKDEGVYISPVTRWAAKAYQAATERAAKLCEERAAAYRSTNAPGWHSVDHECTQCAAAIRASGGKGVA